MKKIKSPKIYPTPPASVTIILISQKKILLVRKRDGLGKGYWTMPGGYVEFNESPEKAIRRELREETGVAYKGELQILDAVEDTLDPSGSGIEIFYLANLNKVEGILNETEEADKISFFDTSLLPKPMNSIHQDILIK